MKISRRTINSWALGGLATTLLPGALGAATPDKYAAVAKGDSDFGSFTQPWFLDSFLELADDLEEAASAGKRFAIMWDLDGCPYCRETHLVNFAIPEVQDYVEANFEIIQMDLRGARDAVDFDGTNLTERELAKRNAIRFTPTFQFFPETLAEVDGKVGQAAEVARIPGYLRPYHFLTFFKFVREKAYAKGKFPAYLKDQVAALKADGKSIPKW